MTDPKDLEETKKTAALLRDMNARLPHALNLEDMKIAAVNVIISADHDITLEEARAMVELVVEAATLLKHVLGRV